MPFWYICIFIYFFTKSFISFQILKKETGRKLTMNVKLISVVEHDHDVHGTSYNYFEQILTMGVNIVGGAFAKKSVSGSGW